MTKRVLIVEDEFSIARFLQLEFEYEGYKVSIASEGRKALEKAKEDWDLIILDVMLPDLNGIEVCRRIRSHQEVPIIMLTARDSIPDRVSGLDAGADDYLSKPFAIEELLARVRALFRRKDTQSTQRDTYQLGPVTLYLRERRVFCHDHHELKLTTREFDLLAFLIRNKNHVLNREMILEKVWGYDYDGETNVVDVYIRYLRAKLSQAGVDHFITTVRGVGYVVRDNQDSLAD